MYLHIFHKHQEVLSFPTACCGILEWAQSWSFLGEKVVLVFPPGCVFTHSQANYIIKALIDMMWLYLVVCVSREQWKKTKKNRDNEIKFLFGRAKGFCCRWTALEGRPEIKVVQLLLNVWAYVRACLRAQCRLIHGGREVLVKETSPLTRLLQGGWWRAKPLVCCYHAGLCPPTGLYSNLVINCSIHQIWKWYDLVLLSCVLFLWRKKWITVIRLKYCTIYDIWYASIFS